jgi:hypothetical protein
MLFRLLVGRVLVAPTTVFAELQAIWIILLVLKGGVVAALTDSAGEGDDVFHSQYSWAEKEKSLGYLGGVNSSRGRSRASSVRPNAVSPVTSERLVRIQRWYLRAGLFLLPLAYSWGTYDHYVLPKVVVARVLVLGLLILLTARSWTPFATRVSPPSAIGPVELRSLIRPRVRALLDVEPSGPAGWRLFVAPRPISSAGADDS